MPEVETIAKNIPLTLANRFLPSQYVLNLSIDPFKKNFSGEVTIALVVNSRLPVDSDFQSKKTSFKIELHTLQLISLSASLQLDDGSSYKLKSHLDNKNQITSYETDEITFQDIAKKAFMPHISIKFLGVLHEVLTFQDPTRGVFKTHYMDPESGKATLQLISSHCQPHYARSIFPCLDELYCKAMIVLKLTVAKRFKCISNMPIDSIDEDTSETQKTVTFLETPRMSMSVFSFSIGDFKYLETTTEMLGQSDFPIRIYAPVGEVDRGQYALDVLKKYLPLVEKRFGVKYPIGKVDLVALPFLSDGGVEDWSMIQIMSQQVLLPQWESNDPNELIQHKENIRLVIVHELIHMYMGDYVTYDSYDYTWLNESFATFMANCLIASEENSDLWLELANQDLPNVEETQRSISVKPLAVSNVNTESINDTFSREAYDKGIWVLRMLASVLSPTNEAFYDTFFKMVGDFVTETAFGTFKPVDLWNSLRKNKLNKFHYDVPTIMTSWTHTPGYPLLSVKSVTVDDKKCTVIEQHRFLTDPSLSDQVEDIPYQIPLLLRSENGEIGRQIMTDRNLVLKGGDDIMLVNAECSALVTVKYSLEHYKKLSHNLKLLSPIEQTQLFLDFSTLLGTPHQSTEVLLGFIEIIKGLNKIKSLDPIAMVTALTILTNLGSAVSGMTWFDDRDMYDKITSFIDHTETRLIPQVQWDNLTKLTEQELNLRKALLSLGYKNVTAKKLVKKLYKKLMHGPKGSIPKSLLTPILAIMQTSASAKDYKEIHKLVRNPGLVVQNVVQPAGNGDIQTAAVNSLGFVTDDDLRHKTLNFVNNNNDIAMIELALLGFRLQPDCADQLWSWYKLHFTQMYSRLVRDSRGSFAKFFKTASDLIFECCLNDQQLSNEVHSFVKTRSIPTLTENLHLAENRFEAICSFNANNDALKNAL